MQVSPPAMVAVPIAGVAFHLIRPASLTAKQLAALLLAPPTHLLVDCGWLRAPHPLGACHFISKLLALRRRGTRIRLCRVHPVLLGCLHALALADLFHANE